MKIISSTDGKFIGLEITLDSKSIMLGDRIFNFDKIVQVAPGIWRISNTNYVIDVQE